MWIASTVPPIAFRVTWRLVILSDHVGRYLHELRPERSEVMREMEELAERDSVPIVHWETGRMLAVLCRSLDPVVLEVGTAIGYSTLHMAEALDKGRVVTLERDPTRIEQARGFLERAGVADRVEIVEGDARESIERLEGPFDLLFVDGTKVEYREYIELAGAEAVGARPAGGRQPADVRRGGAARGRPGHVLVCREPGERP